MLLSTTEDVLLGEKINPIWCIDSGCTGHMCNEKQMIKDFTHLNSELNLANSERTQITGTGKVSISVDTGSEERQINLQKVFYVSDLRTNLLSVAKVTDRGFEVHFKKNGATVRDENGKIHLRADRVGNLYHVRMSQNTASKVENMKKSID
ncbi:putative Copia protein [Danaus plexippus plexippus]|uniref:Copia protein n=1 Tax=Danaus plexippus plexippus TaxID=278856 RepID=A0A212EGS6_DANPL|nr:putative Copia protein [Danaus plexippus plexippus]